MALTYNDIATLVAIGQTAEQIAAALPALNESWWRTLSSREALAWLGDDGRMISLETAAANDALPVELRGACRTTLILIQRSDVAIDLSPGSSHRLMLLGCVAAGVFVSADVTALIETTRLRPDPTAAEVQAVIDAHAAIETRNALSARVNAAAAAASLAVEAFGDDAAVRAAMVDAFDGGA